MTLPLDREEKGGGQPVQHERHLAVLLHQPGGQTAAGMEAGRRGGEVGRESGGRSGQEAEKEEGGHGGAGEGSQLPRPAQQLRDDPPFPGRTAAGVSQERPAARHLLQSVALAGPAVPP